MKTANEMYQYCLKNNFDQNWDEETALKHLQIIEQNLQSDEEVIMCFLGKREIMNGKCAFAITDKQNVIWGQRSIYGRWYKEIPFSTITNISFSGGMFKSMISFNAVGDTYSPLNTSNTNFSMGSVTCSVKNNTAQIIYKKCRELFEKTNESLLENKQIGNSFSVADEILKYKKLLDAGAITQEEFEIKKKQLLNQ